MSENTMMVAVEIDGKTMEFAMASGGRRYVQEEAKDAIVGLERQKTLHNLSILSLWSSVKRRTNNSDFASFPLFICIGGKSTTATKGKAIERQRLLLEHLRTSSTSSSFENLDSSIISSEEDLALKHQLEYQAELRASVFEAIEEEDKAIEQDEGGLASCTFGLLQ
ncbi:hypothetical protein L2E82_47865 [Cichorium intybus]|uniref:Uncharacterized protein n=1 Tax=Cichorium intybus TaxID=13427 RepID=A0ACB8YXX3_CICIN|nr:hypothetical protein L2E82_47865 [Cichorium intybus]